MYPEAKVVFLNVLDSLFYLEVASMHKELSGLGKPSKQTAS
jgi:hypothetical protein